MVRISAINRRNDGLLEVLSDGEVVALLDGETAGKLDLTAGGMADERVLAQQSAQCQQRFAKRKALNLLARQDYSHRQLADKLRSSVDAGTAERTVERMEELGFLDDRKVALAMARNYIERKGYAPGRAKFELVQKGIDRDTASEAVEQVPFDPAKSIETIIRRKYGGRIEDEKKRRRVAAALQRYGYGAQDIVPALRTYQCEELPEDEATDPR